MELKEYVNQIVSMIILDRGEQYNPKWGKCKSHIIDADCSSVVKLESNLLRFHLPVFDGWSETIGRPIFNLIIKDYAEDYLVFYLRSNDMSFYKGLRIDSHDLIEEYIRLKLKNA